MVGAAAYLATVRGGGMIVRRYLTERLRDPGSDRALCSAPPPPHCGQWGQRRRGLGGPRPVVFRRRVHCGVDASLVIGVVVAVGGRWGGGTGRLAEFLEGVRRTSIETARRVGQGSARAEGEEGGSGGVWARDGVPRAGGELGSGG